MQWLSDLLYQWITVFLFAIAFGFTLYFLSEKDQVGIHLTPVATTCSMARDGRFSAGSNGI